MFALSTFTYTPTGIYNNGFVSTSSNLSLILKKILQVINRLSSEWLTCAIPEPMRPPPTTVTVLIAFSDEELEKFLVIPINLFILYVFTERKPPAKCDATSWGKQPVWDRTLDSRAARAKANKIALIIIYDNDTFGLKKVFKVEITRLTCDKRIHFEINMLHNTFWINSLQFLNMK